MAKTEHRIHAARHKKIGDAEARRSVRVRLASERRSLTQQLARRLNKQRAPINVQ